MKERVSDGWVSVADPNGDIGQFLGGALTNFLFQAIFNNSGFGGFGLSPTTGITGSAGVGDFDRIGRQTQIVWDDWYRDPKTKEVFWQPVSGKVEGLEHLGPNHTISGRYVDLVHEQNNFYKVVAKEKYGGDGSGSFLDVVAKGLSSLNKYNPFTSFSNVFSYARTGEDIYGNKMNLFGGTMQAVGVFSFGVGGVGKSAGVNAAKGGSTILYRAVSKAELDDIAINGIRNSPGYETGKLFATSAQDAANFGRLNFGLDKQPFTIIKTSIPNKYSPMLYRGEMDLMQAVSVPSNLFNQLSKPSIFNKTGLPYHPWIK